jgi:hypothetical protein
MKPRSALILIWVAFLMRGAFYATVTPAFVGPPIIVLLWFGFVAASLTLLALTGHTLTEPSRKP